MDDSDDGPPPRKCFLEEDRAQKGRAKPHMVEVLAVDTKMKAWDITEDGLLCEFIHMNLFRFFNHRDQQHKLKLFDMPASYWVGSKSYDKVKSHMQKVFSGKKKEILAESIGKELQAPNPNPSKPFQAIYRRIVQAKRPQNYCTVPGLSIPQSRATYSEVTQLDNSLPERQRSNSFAILPEDENDGGRHLALDSLTFGEEKTECSTGCGEQLELPNCCLCGVAESKTWASSTRILEEKLQETFENASNDSILKRKIKILKTLMEEEPHCE